MARGEAAFAFRREGHARYYAIHEQKKKAVPHFVYEVTVVGKSSLAAGP